VFAHPKEGHNLHRDNNQKKDGLKRIFWERRREKKTTRGKKKKARSIKESAGTGKKGEWSASPGNPIAEAERGEKTRKGGDDCRRGSGGKKKKTKISPNRPVRGPQFPRKKRKKKKKTGTLYRVIEKGGVFNEQTTRGGD